DRPGRAPAARQAARAPGDRRRGGEGHRARDPRAGLARVKPRQLFWRTVIAGIADVAMATGIYPLVPHAAMAGSRWRKERAQPRGQVGAALREWAMAVGVSAARPLGFLGLPGAQGPRPVIVVHGYAMNRANFLVLAKRLARAGLGPVLGFEYWTLG